jgi:hypothetical protein
MLTNHPQQRGTKKAREDLLASDLELEKKLPIEFH